jgi:hypothetical protein
MCLECVSLQSDSCADPNAHSCTDHSCADPNAHSCTDHSCADPNAHSCTNSNAHSCNAKHCDTYHGRAQVFSLLRCASDCRCKARLVRRDEFACGRQHSDSDQSNTQPILD